MDSHALQAMNNGVLNIYDVDGDGGSLVVTTTGEFRSCAHASSGGDINITGTLTAIFPGGTSYQEIIGLNASGAGSTITLVGNASGYYGGAVALNGATITVTGNVEGGYYGAYAAYGGLVDITGNVTAGTNGLTVEYGGLAEVDGDITGGTGLYLNNMDGYNPLTVNVSGDITSTSDYAVSASGGMDIDVEGNVTGQVNAYTTSTSSIDITGNIAYNNGSAIIHQKGNMVVTGDVTSANGWGVFSDSNLTLNGNIVALKGIHSYSPSGNIILNGNITANGSYGVYIDDGATVTVNGTISGAYPYIQLGDVNYSEGSGTIEGDYMKYSTYTNDNPAYVHTVYVLIPQPEEPPAGGGSSGSTVVYYSITATAGEGGSINPAGFLNVQKDKSKTYKIIPNSGYVIANVLVDGVSVGAVEEYTFTQIDGNHTISAVFQDPTKNFIDVDRNLWYKEGIDFVLLKDLFEGTSETTFEPNAKMTRAMLVTVLWRLEKEPDATIEKLFEDIQDGIWYKEAVVWAAANGIVEGYNERNFGPADPITREQMAAILHRYATFKGYEMNGAGDLSGFSDAGNTSNWALATMKWANAEGLIKGVSDSRLDPAGYATRAQVATILMRFVENIVREVDK